jgi:NAD(P)-dependent dehydrogenase (short-subunit alcohol dehydrogenase family)
MGRPASEVSRPATIVAGGSRAQRALPLRKPSDSCPAQLSGPNDVAGAVSFLASDDSSYISGIELFVDGGLAQV